MKKILPGVAAMLMLQAFAGVSNLTGEFRNGQLFLQWQESDLPADARLSVWSSDKPITAENIGKADKTASLLNPRSARDWWLDPASFVIKRSKKAKSEEIFAGKVADVGAKKLAEKGFIITDHGKPISPDGGLHVHTPKAGQSGSRYYAVTVHKGTSAEILDMTSTVKPVKVGKGEVNAIAIVPKGKIPSPAAAKGKPILIYLHGRGGGSGVDSRGNAVGTHIMYADSTLAWREGIPYKFTVVPVKDGKGGIKYLRIVLNDRTWTGRKLTRAESPDSRDYVPAIASFWLGYNTNLGVSNLGPEFQWDNYSERVIIQIVNWVHKHFGTDSKRTYLYGGSMGGSGTVQMALHYPDVFAAAYAKVPVYSYTWAKMPKFPKLQPSIYRMQCSIGRFKPEDKVISPDGKDLLVYGNGAIQIARPQVDIPPIFATNGRRDMSIPWVNNPPFFRAANQARQAFAVHWNNGGHGMDREVPAITTTDNLLRYRLDQAFPAFSNSSDNRNYGNGDPDDGDLEGWQNRGMNWTGEIVDTPERFEMSLVAAHKDIKYPVISDVTFRRRQKFVFAPGTVVKVDVNGIQRDVTIDKDGLLTVTGVKFTDASPVKIVCSKK